MDGRGGAPHHVNPRRGADYGDPPARTRQPPHAAKVQVPLGAAHLHAGGKAEERGGIGAGEDAGEVGDPLDAVQIHHPLADGRGGAGSLVQALAEAQHGVDALAGKEAERIVRAAAFAFRRHDDLLHRILLRQRGGGEESQDGAGKRRE